MSLGISRREARTPPSTLGSYEGSSEVTAPKEVRHTPIQETAGKVVMGAYAAGVFGGVLVAGAALAAFTGLIATGVIDHHYGTHLSDVLLTHAGPFESVMKGGTVFIGSCAALMCAGLGVIGVSDLAARLRRAPTR